MYESGTTPAAEGNGPQAEVGTATVASPQPVYRYTIQTFTLTKVDPPVQIPGDSRREMIGFYWNSDGDMQLCPTLGVIGTDAIVVTQFAPTFEVRKSSHGPLCQDGWTLSGPLTTSTVTVITIVPEG